MITKYYLTEKAKKELGKLPKNVQKRVINKLDYYINLRNPINAAESLFNYELGSYRYRIGSYRVIFDVEKERIIILKVGHRREIYK